jgi:thiol-disulfide isomerase/thioredoxin
VWWLNALLAAQVVDCPLEPELVLPPAGDWREVKLVRVAGAKGFEQWEGGSLRLARRIADGAVGLVIDGKVAKLQPLGLQGWLGQGDEAYGRRGFDRAPVAVRVRRGALGFGAAEVKVERNGSVALAARCAGRLLVGDVEGQGPWGYDGNGDGKVDVNSPAEYVRGRGGEAAFVQDGKTWVVAGVDWEARRVRLREGEPVVSLKMGEQLADYEYTDRLGVKRRLSESAEDLVLLDFWAAWCAPCIAAFPQLQAMAEAYEVAVLGFNGDEDSETASRALAQFGVLWPDVQGTQPRGLYDARLRVAQYPTYVLLDRQRRVIWQGHSTVEVLEVIRQRAKKRN